MYGTWYFCLSQGHQLVIFKCIMRFVNTTQLVAALQNKNWYVCIVWKLHSKISEAKVRGATTCFVILHSKKFSDDSILHSFDHRK